MGKHYILPALALAGGLAGFGLRLWQRTSALDPVTELFATGAPATLALWGLMRRWHWRPFCWAAAGPRRRSRSAPFTAPPQGT